MNLSLVWKDYTFIIFYIYLGELLCRFVLDAQNLDDPQLKIVDCWNGFRVLSHQPDSCLSDKYGILEG